MRKKKNCSQWVFDVDFAFIFHRIQWEKKKNCIQWDLNITIYCIRFKIHDSWKLYTKKDMIIENSFFRPVRLFQIGGCSSLNWAITIDLRIIMIMINDLESQSISHSNICGIVESHLSQKLRILGRCNRSIYDIMWKYLLQRFNYLSEDKSER